MKPHSLIILSTALGLLLVNGCNRQAVKDPALEANNQTQLAPCTLGSTPNVHKLEELYLAGQPKQDDFQAAKTDGIRTIVNLRHSKEIKDFDEEALVKAAGLNYVHLPWNGEDELTDDVFQRGRDLFESAEKPLLMHCGSANRVGALWIPWRVLDGKVSFDDALAEAKTIGLKSGGYEQKAREYVERMQTEG